MNKDKNESEKKPSKPKRLPSWLILKWVFVMNRDPDLLPSAFKVGVCIASHFNSYSGETFLAQETIAGEVKVSVRTIVRACKDLKSRGHLIVNRPKWHPNSESVSNTYQPAFNHVRVEMVNGEQRPWGNDDRSSTKSENDETGGRPKHEPRSPAKETGCDSRPGVKSEFDLRPPSDPTTSSHEGHPLPSEGQRDRSDPREKPDMVGASTNPDPSDQYSSHVGARVNVHEDLLSKITSELNREVGESAFRSWFSTTGFDIVSSNESTITFALATPFLKDWVAGHYDIPVLRCARRICPTVERVNFVVAGARTAGRSG
jgi:hypothetical protein